MKIIIFGATSIVGNFLIEQALAKGYFVKAFGRNVEKLIDKDLRSENFEAIKGFVFDEKDVKNAIKGCDVVISCLGGNTDGTDQTRSLGMKNIIKQMQYVDCKRIIAIGGIGILQSNEDKMIFETPDFPEDLKAVSLEHLSAYNMLVQTNFDYTFVCPPRIVNKPLQSDYFTQMNYPPTPNSYQINAGSLSHFMIKCAEEHSFNRQKIGICN